MHRFILLGLALASLGQAASKPKPPAISVCAGPICLNDLRWLQPDALYGRSLPGISGTLANFSKEPIGNVVLQFGLVAGSDLIGTAIASLPARLGPGGTWAFDAVFVESQGTRFVVLSNAVQVDWTGLEDGQPKRFSQVLSFDPLFNPANRAQQKQWEAIHGKRKR